MKDAKNNSQRAERVRVVVDAMGGDRGPSVMARAGAEAALADPDIDVILVGDEKSVEDVLNKIRIKPKNLKIVHASDVVGMSESPASASPRSHASASAGNTRPTNPVPTATTIPSPMRSLSSRPVRVAPLG